MADRILVVDDDELMRDSLQLSLESAGYRVDVAQDGFAALEMVRGEPYDLVICDVRMPGMGGMEALSAVRDIQPGARHIVISGYASAEAPLQALKLRVDDYLMKPFSTDDLLISVRRSLEEHRRGGGDARAAGVREALHRVVADLLGEDDAPRRLQRVHRVARASLRVARGLGFSARRARTLHLAALLNDLGASTGQEAHALLAPVEALREVARFIQHATERWDGAGVPAGLRGADIPLESRVLAVARAFADGGLEAVEAAAGRSLDGDLAGVLRASLDGESGDDLAALEVLEHEVGDAAALVGLGDTFRDLGNPLVAERAYRRAEEIASAADSDLAVRARLGLAQTLLTQGRGQEALDAADQARALALKHGAALEAARATLVAAALRWDAGDVGALEEALVSARTALALWEARTEACLCDLYLAALATRAGSEDAARLHVARWLSEMEASRSHTVLASASAPAARVLTAALSRGPCADEATGMLKAAGAHALEVLERLLACADVTVKMRVLDVLGSFPEAQARALLSRARMDGAAVVAQKSSLLLQRGAPAEAVAPPPLQVFLLGRFRVVVGEGPLDDEAWPTRKVRSLFAYFATRRGEVVHEERLMDLFWEQGGERARHSLHNAVSQIRRLLGAGVLARKRDGYQLDPGTACWIDLEAFQEACGGGRLLSQQGRWDEALASLSRADRLYGGAVLEGWYDEWVEDLRTATRERLLEALGLMGAHAAAQGRHDTAMESWRKVLAHDNCREDAWMGLMQAHAAAGRPGEAIRAYHQCVETFKKELDLAPPPPLVEAYLRIAGG